VLQTPAGVLTVVDYKGVHMAEIKPTKFEKPDGTSLYRVRVNRARQGVKVQKYFRLKKDAEKYCRELTDKLASGDGVADNVQAVRTFQEAVDEYLEQPLAQPNGKPLKASTAADRTQRLRWLCHIFGNVLLKNLGTPEKVISLLDEDREWGSRGTRGNYISALSALFTWCANHKPRYMAFNPMKGFDQARDTTRRERTWTAAEWKRMLKAADARGDHLGLLLRVLWATGCRRGEALRLRWVDVGEDDGLLSLYFDETKNGSSRTVFTADKDLKNRLKQHRLLWGNHSLVFPPAYGELWSAGKPYREARIKAKLDQPDEKYGERLSMHHIRHTWATELGKRGATLQQLMAAGGWKTQSQPLRYMKVQEAQAKEAARLMMGGAK
jgi:integrase